MAIGPVQLIVLGFNHPDFLVVSTTRGSALLALYDQAMWDKYQLAKRAGAYTIATAGPRSADAVRAQGADQIVDYTATSVTAAVTEPVDAVLNLVAAPESDIAALTALIRDGGVIVTTATPAAGDPQRAVRAVAMQLRTDAGQLADLAKLVDGGKLKVEISDTRPLAEAAAVHALSAAGAIRGKVLLVPAGAES